MITFKSFLNENNMTPKGMSDTEIIEWCEKNARKFLDNEPTNIYRGMFNIKEQGGVIDTNMMSRVSANTENYYTVWVDNNETWADYPKRSKSYICSTDFESAGDFGTQFIIIPGDDCIIGKCSAHDFWHSFPEVKSELGIYTMDNWNKIFNLMIKMKSDKSDFHDTRALLASNYSEFVKFLKEFDMTDFEKFLGFNLDGQTTTKKMIKRINNPKGTLYDLWVDVLDPKRNEFKVYNSATFRSSYNVEVWVQGNIMAIKNSVSRGGVLHEFLKDKGLI